MRGGYRPGSGPRKGTKYRPRVKQPGAAKQKPIRKPRKPKEVPADIVAEAKALDLTPLDYMLKVMNDPMENDKARKDRMAIAAAPFVHPRPGESKGKKAEKDDAARKAGAGRFQAGAPPIRVVK